MNNFKTFCTEAAGMKEDTVTDIYNLITTKLWQDQANKYPDYNSNDEHTQKSIDYIISKLDTSILNDEELQTLKDKIRAGIT